jgi:hypothetical protein
MDPRLQALIDRQDIIDVLHQYSHGCDRGDEARMADIYHPESWDDHGIYKGDGRAFAKQVCGGTGRRETMSHLLGQSQIKVDGDSAGVETYYNATIQRRNEEGVRYVDMMGGRYIDKLERRDGKWRVLDRLCTCEWSFTLRVEQELEWHPTGKFYQGTTDKSDRSYEVLGLD